MTKLPYDLETSRSVAEAPNAKFLQVKADGNGQVQAEVPRATLRSTIEVVPQAKKTDELTGDLKGEAVVWDVYQTVPASPTRTR